MHNNGAAVYGDYAGIYRRHKFCGAAERAAVGACSVFKWLVGEGIVWNGGEKFGDKFGKATRKYLVNFQIRGQSKGKAI